MNIEHQELSSSPPPPLEEGYWKTLLHEGEYAGSLSYHEKTHANDYRPSSEQHRQASYNHEETYSDADAQAIERDWTAIEAVMQQDKTVDLHVIGYNRGGLLVQWRNLRGFVPASQLLHFPTSDNTSQRQERLSKHVNNTLTLRVIELNRQQQRLVFSERAAQVEPGTREQVLNNVTPREIVEGIVTNITDFGVFVDLGGIEGLVHISELSWGRVSHPGDMVSRGEQVRIYVLDTNKDEGRIALSIKRLFPDPWQTVKARYEVGQVIEGKITNVVEFGAFVRIEHGLEGLIHVSELAEGHFLHPRNVVEEGQLIEARILSIEPDKRRLGLSTRQHTK